MEQTEYIHNFSKVLDKYSVVCNWLQTLGFDYSSSRYGIYKRLFHELISAINKRDYNGDISDLFRKFRPAYIEMNEIIRTYNALNGMESSEFVAQLAKVVSGKAFSSNGEESRNFLFELNTATRFIKAGYSVKLNNVCDVVVDLGPNGKLFVECKRVSSEGKLSQNIKKASKQISVRIKESVSKKVKGLIAINVSELLPDTTSFHPSSFLAATRIHRGTSNQFCRSHFDKIRDGESDKCIGVMLESAKMFVLSEDASKGGFIYSRHAEFCGYSSSDLLSRLAPDLSNHDL